MRAELGLPSVKGDDETGGGMTGGFGGSMGGAGTIGKAKRPINVKFEIPYFTTSGIQVRYLKITEPKVCSERDAQYTCYRNRPTLTNDYSCNIPPSPGSATSHNQATSPSACRTSNRRFYLVIARVFVQPLVSFPAFIYVPLITLPR